MNADRYRQIDKIFAEVLEISAARRTAFLSEKCGDDGELKTEVLNLLKAQTEAEEFMENSAMNLLAQELAEENRAEIFSLVGKQFGTYQIEKPIGAGGMGEVYLAHETKLNRKVALKILPAEFLTDAERVKRFEREALAVSALNHPYIVTIHDVGSADGINYIATEFVEGETVRDLINRGADLKQTLSIISQTCEALAAAHKAGIVHRDIKPENIMIRPDGFVKVLDFGLAKLVENTEFQQSLSNYTMKGIIIGTPAYMSPEQVGDEKVDQRTDLWSVGVVLFEMLTGINPFKGESRQATFQKILSEEPPLVSELNGKLPVKLDAILSKALEKDADLSYQTASDIRADLKRVRREFDSSSSLRSASGTRKRGDAEMRRNYLIPAFGVLLLALIGFGIWFFVFRLNQNGAIDWSKATNVQLTDQSGTEFFPTLEPDGKSFVYASDASGNFDLYFQRVGGKNPTILTKDSSEDDTQPAFSPSGEQIAFRSEREPKGIYLMGASGENPRRVADFGFTPSWSPDGKEIVVSTHNQDIPLVYNPASLWIINVETGAKRLLIENYAATQPAWSPNGKRIAFWFTGDRGRRDIVTISAQGGEPKTVTDTGNTNWNPVWSPDGAFLYFASDRGGSMAFWRARVDEDSGEVSGAPEIIQPPAKYNRHLSFSRDGKRLIYVQTDNQSNIKTVGFDLKSGQIVGEPSSVTRGDREVIQPELSPDGRQFLMRQIFRTQEDLVVMNRDGTNPRQLTNDLAFDRYARWSPDGKKVIFASDRSGKYAIWTIDADGSNLRQIIFFKERVSGMPSWSPDGRRVSFDDASQSYIFDATGNWSEESLQKFPSPGGGSFFRAWDWSPDGKKIAGYFEGGTERGMAYYSLETGAYEKLTDYNRFAYWMPDNRRLIYAHNGKIIILDTEIKKTREMSPPADEQIRGVNISRDGKLLYYTVFSSESNIWLLDVSTNP